MHLPRTLLFQTLGFAVLMVLLGLSVPGCISPPDYPDTPEIEFRRVTIQPIVNRFGPFDSVNITIGYRDGDGDLGLNNNDTLPPFNLYLPNTKIDNPKRVNYFCQIQIRRTDGTFLDYTPPGDDINGTYPNLTPASQGDRAAPLRGEIYYQFKISPTLDLPPGTAIRFKINILDRALNRSNEVFTETVTIPQ
ncbi:hypothetical protein D0N36_08170 [Hymenobacter lapidiphilus]|uniref:hypothetical protein n=1 Tax=Hymenobacter sp. CCM 8763 TaxID=2303334 RepID=UPI000E34FF77|nr:hypothetical protein [Hymenobacter sp. CCM 8763]RFP65657.1 hypothetical protein D0N36_08170 [Hymenobacter sp. CCM 8763]